MDSTKRVELVRIEREEQVFAREDIVGRDASSVFPTETRKAEVDARAQAFKALFGDNRQFVTETELQDFEDAAHKRATPEDTGPSRPLAEILQEAKEAKDQKFKDTWKQMKIGKNRPLDEDELEFLDSLAEEEVSKRRKLAAEEVFEAETYRRMREEQEARREREAAPAGPQPQAVTTSAPAHVACKRRPRLAVRALVKPKNDENGGSRPGSDEPELTAASDANQTVGPGSSAQQQDEGQQKQPADVLGGLLGAYSSDSD